MLDLTAIPSLDDLLCPSSSSSSVVIAVLLPAPPQGSSSSIINFIASLQPFPSSFPPYCLLILFLLPTLILQPPPIDRPAAFLSFPVRHRAFFLPSFI